MSKLSLGVQKAIPQPAPRESSLALLSDATRMLAEAKTLDELRQIRDVAVAAAAYARAHQLGRDAQRYAVEIAARASRRMAELDPPQQGARTDLSASADKLPVSRQRRSENRDLLALSEEELAGKVRAMTHPSLSRVRRVARDAKAGQAREQKAAIAVLPSTCDLRFGDFREVLADVPDGSVDVVLTDPPYPAKFLPLWGDLGAFAARVLRPDGLLVAMSGQTHLPAVFALLGEHMVYRWTIAYLMDGAANTVHARAVQTMWKPVVVYGGTGRRLHDVARSDEGDKAHHGWGQSESGMAALLRLVADPGQVVCDPFVGGGTTGLVALDYGCSFIGAELERNAYETALVRLAS